MKILVIQEKMIGDVLTSSIIFQALRKKFPEAELHYLIQPHTRPVIDNNPYINCIVLSEPGLLQFSKKIRKEQYDIVIDVYSKLGTAFITAYSGAKTRISYHKCYTSYAYTHTFRYKEELQTHAGFAIENRMMLLQGISADFPMELKPQIYLTPTEKDKASDYLQAAGISKDKPLFMIGILGSSLSKTYPFSYMAEVLDFIVTETSAQLLFNYIPKQEEQAEEILMLCKPETRKHIHFNVFGKSLREFLAITSHCDALIGNEGGAVNMAKALNIPTFAIFSPQIQKETWSLYEDGVQNVSVHLKDYKPDLFQGLLKKELANKSAGFYEQFEPALVFDKLGDFLKANRVS